MAWYNASWKYRIKLTVATRSGDAESTSSFPVYVELNSTDFDATFWSNVLNGGGDIRVTTSDEETECAREVVSCDTSSSTGEVHFLAPSISNSSDTDFYIYFGNSGASDYAATDTYGRNAVWTGYSAVYHMHQDPSGSAPQMTDSTGNDNDGTANGTTDSSDIVTAKAGKGMTFNGSDESVSAAYDATLELADTGSIMLWAKPAATTSGTHNLISYGALAAGQSYVSGYLINRSSDNIFFYWKKSSPVVQANDVLTAGSWYHIAMVDNAGTLEAYVNGSSVGTGSSGGSITANYTTYIGGSDNEWFESGVIDEVRIATFAASASYVSSFYDNTNDPGSFYTAGASEANSTLANGLQFGYKMDEDAANTTVNDVLATTTGTSVNNTADMSTDGVVGKAFQFTDANSDSISLGTGGGPGAAWTMSAWMYVDTTWDAQDKIFNNRPSSGDGNEIRFQLNENGSPLKMQVVAISSGGSGGNAYKNYLGATTLTPETWYHVAASWGGDGLKIYVNGAQDTPYTKSVDGSLSMTDTSKPRAIGRYSGGTTNRFDGKLHSFYLWNRQLTDAEVAELYSSGNRLDYPFTDPVATSTDYTLDVTVASFSLSGIANALSVGRTLATSVASFTLTGIAAAFKIAYGLVTTTGSFVLSGITTTLTTAFTLATSVGTFTLTGIAATFARGYGIVTSTGSFVLTGIAATLKSALTLAASVGTFTLTGIAALFKRGYTLALSTGTFALTGIASLLSAGHTLATSVASYTLTGIASTFAVARAIVALVGSFIVSGKDISFGGTGSWRLLFQDKNTSSLTFQGKNASSLTYANKNASSLTYQDKKASSLTYADKKTSSLTYQDKS